MEYIEIRTEHEIFKAAKMENGLYDISIVDIESKMEMGELSIEKSRLDKYIVTLINGWLAESVWSEKR